MIYLTSFPLCGGYSNYEFVPATNERIVRQWYCPYHFKYSTDWRTKNRIASIPKAIKFNCLLPILWIQIDCKRYHVLLLSSLFHTDEYYPPCYLYQSKLIFRERITEGNTVFIVTRNPIRLPINWSFYYKNNLKVGLYNIISKILIFFRLIMQC